MFGGYYFGQAYPGQAGAVTPVSSTPSVSTFAGFGGGFAGPVRGGRKKKKKREEEVQIPALQNAIAEMVTANAPPLPNTKAVFRPTVKARGKAELVMDAAEVRRKRIVKDDEEILMLMKYL